MLDNPEKIANPLRVGIGGPVGSGKTALCELLCKRLRDEYEMAVTIESMLRRRWYLLHVSRPTSSLIYGIEMAKTDKIDDLLAILIELRAFHETFMEFLGDHCEPQLA